MSEEPQRPRTGDILVGIFLILFGLCITLVGGTCTVAGIARLMERVPSSGFGAGWLGTILFLISVVTAVLGLVCMAQGIRLARGRRGRADGGDG
jgi:hypothetical protein